MQNDDNEQMRSTAEGESSGGKHGQSRSLFDVPEPVKRVFDKVPLVTYQASELPRRTLSTRSRGRHTLHVFTSSKGARSGEPSFNPGCLKWQAYLKFAGVDFETVPSNNHASPTGVLPFLLPAQASLAANPPLQNPVPSNKLEKWVLTQKSLKDERLGMRYEAYLTLLDFRIRTAWLHTLYLDDRNFEAVARPLYIDPCSSNFIVKIMLAYQLQRAARDELHKQSTFIDVDDIYVEAGNAFNALSTLLGDDTYFFDRNNPGLFDASVFAYTHLILDDNMGWENKRLGQMLRKNQNLVQHQQRLLEDYFKQR